MIVEGKNLFPLQHLESRFRGYYVDAAGNIYSNRGGKRLMLLSGSRPHGSTIRYYTLDGASFSHADLLRKVRNHMKFVSETAAVPPVTVSNAPSQSSAVLAALKATAPAGRAHAASVDAGIAGRGAIIGSVQNGGLSFANSPVIHMTEASLKAEMQRLATLSPGTKYVALQITGALVAGGLSWQ